MRNLNAFANGLRRSYKTRANAERALGRHTRARLFDYAMDGRNPNWDSGASNVIVARDDGRFSVVIINTIEVAYWVAAGFAVWS